MLVGVSSAGGMKRDPLPFVQPIPPFRRMRKKERGEKRSAVKAKEAGSRKSNQISLIQLCGIEDFAMCLAGARPDSEDLSCTLISLLSISCLPGSVNGALLFV